MPKGLIPKAILRVTVLTEIKKARIYPQQMLANTFQRSRSQAHKFKQSFLFSP